MHYFLDPDFDPAKGMLNAEESRHLSKVLRLRAGDSIQVGDGKGGVYTGTVEHTSLESTSIRVAEEEIFPEPEGKVRVAIAPTKNLSRFEWFLEKATELGVWQIIPIITARTLRDRIKESRAEKIVLQASKQSQRYFIPEISVLTAFDDILKPEADERLIAHCREDLTRHPLSVKYGNEDTLILIGPEGDFTSEEIAKAEDAGFRPVILGENRLRTETAGILAVALLQLSEV